MSTIGANFDLSEGPDEAGPAPFLLNASRARVAAPGVWSFIFLILVTATLFVRPADLLPALQDWPIYAAIAIVALAVALPALLGQLTFGSLVAQPITACVVGMLAAVILSHLSSYFIWGARMSGMEFFKVLLYYLLVVGAVNSVERLRSFLGWLGLLTVVVAGLAVLQYHGVIDLPALAEIEQGQVDPETGEGSLVMRLVSTGIFNDPNDLCLLLVLAMAACAHGIEDQRWGSWRFAWLAPLTLFGYAMMLTQSRGGFLGLTAALVVFIWARFGRRKGLPLAVLALPVMFYLFAGRQTELDVADGTGQERIQLWSEALTQFRHAPIFGIGYGKLAEDVGQVTHNSFLHSFAELGFFGGVMFLGAFAMAFRMVQRLGPSSQEEPDDDLMRLRPYLMAIVVGYAVGMMSLSRAYVVPTYLILGLAAAYVQLARAQVVESVPAFGMKLVTRLAMLGVGFIGCMYVFVRLFVHWG